MERKTETGMPSTYITPEVKVIPLMTQRPILEGSGGDGTFNFPGIPPGGGV